MKSSHKFLKLYVKDLDVRDKEFSEGITLTGTKIETYERMEPGGNQAGWEGSIEKGLLGYDGSEHAGRGFGNAAGN